MSGASQPISRGHESLIPHLTCSPCTEAIAFYKQALGAEEVYCMPAPDGKRVMHAELRIGSSHIFLNDDFPEYSGGKANTATALGGTPVSLHLYVKDCDAAIARAKDAGARVAMPAQDMFWGDRYGMVVDPYGHKWSFATHIQDLSPDQIQAAMKEAFAKGPSGSCPE